ncbi:MAG: hypothetical protein K2K36_04895 [Muribaculaceae bacterium]|nr:hypothetical protein [Muribaculaceae bacterium]
MKRFTLSVAACVLAVSAWAHRDVYYTYSFTKADNLGHSSWSYEGADYMEGTAEALLVANGLYSHNGKPSIMIQHDQRSNGERLMPNLSEVHLEIVCGTADGGASHVTPMLEIEDEYGDKVYFDFAPIDNTQEEVQNITSTGIRGDLSMMGQVNFVRIYFDGVDADNFEVVAPYRIAMCSGWTAPVVSANNTAVTMDYGKNPSGLRVEEKGVTYIQAEDFDEMWVNGRLAHSRMSGTSASGYRLNTEDQSMRIECSDDGAPVARYADGHGRILASHVTTAVTGGRMIIDFCPSGADWEKYYGAYEDADGGITLENAIANWGAWTEYTFEVKENCQLGISLSVAAHRNTYEPQVSKGSNCFGAFPEDNGYYLVDEPNNEFFKTYGHKYRVAFDGEIIRTAYDKSPKYNGDGVSFLKEVVVNPDKWTNDQETVNGQQLNSKYLVRTPYPFWSYDSGNDDALGAGWQSFYIKDMLQEAVDRGLVSAAVAEPYMHSDYIVDVKAGTHTIKVQNLGGINAFDEIKLEVLGAAGVESVLADGIEGAFEGTPVYFDLNGRQVEHPAGGIFIKKTGSKVEKVVIR